MLRQAYRLLEDGVQKGFHLGAQLYVSLEGRIVADVGIGNATVTQPMTNETMTVWMSVTKGVSAAAVAQMWEAGEIGIDDPVCTHLPEFAVQGKSGVTFRHLLTHTSGLGSADIDWSADTWDEIIAKICRVPLLENWDPGAKARYDVRGAWFILAELVSQKSGLPFSDYIRKKIFEPLTMDNCYLSMDSPTYLSKRDMFGLMYDTSEGEPKVSHYSRDLERTIMRCVPGGSGRGPARELGRFYEMLLGMGQLNGTRILLPQTVAAITARHRTGLEDEGFGHIIDMGLGFYVNSNLYGEESVPYGFGRHASMRAFGNAGYQSSIAFVDPDARLVVVCIFNGTPGDDVHQIRNREANSAIYEDLGLA